MILLHFLWEAQRMFDSKRNAIILMSLVVVVWGSELCVGRALINTFSTVNVLMFKYPAALIGVTVMKKVFARDEKTEKKDFIMYFLATFFGVVLYMICEYTAMRYMPISLVTIVLGFVPVVSIIIDRILYGKRMTGKIILGVAGSVIGVAIVIGTDFHLLFEGRLIGYILAFLAVISWNAYNFMMTPLSGKYSDVTAGFNQILCAFLMMLPMQLTHLPEVSLLTPGMVVGIIYLGLVSAMIGYIVEPIALRNLGPTTTGIFSNFLPVTSTVFAWAFLGQSLTIVQIIGCAIVIGFSCLVIVEVGKRDGA